MNDEPSLVDRGSAIMNYRKKMAPVFVAPECKRETKVDYDAKIKRKRGRPAKKLLKPAEDNEEW